MQYGICHLSCIPLRASGEHASSLTTQLFYGDPYKILERLKLWSRIRIAFDSLEGWISNDQLRLISESAYTQLENSHQQSHSTDLVSFVDAGSEGLIPVLLGSCVSHTEVLPYTFDGNSVANDQNKASLIRTALLYLHAPYCQGGKSPFGIDAPGLTQMVYKINGYKLLRTANEQATQGLALSFIEESEAGDLAFFDNSEGTIDHVGLIMENNYIIHVHGQVRIDRLDHTGIFNTDSGTYTHQLRVIKKIA